MGNIRYAYASPDAPRKSDPSRTVQAKQATRERKQARSTKLTARTLGVTL